MMAKPKCEICNVKRAKRKCLVSDGQFICPSCCADLRNELCEGCRHYQTAVRYEATKIEAKAKKKFMIEITEEHAQSYGNIGICYAQLGDKSKALAALDEALRIDPEYEPAIANKIHVERMREGHSLTMNKMKSIEYYREYPHKKKSYLQSLLDENAE